MRRSVSYVLVMMAVALGVLVSGCGGGGPTSTVGPVAKVVLSPSSVSLTPGQAAQLTAQAQDSSGKSVLSATITFSSSNSAIQVANNGLVCAGTWDSLTSPVVCTPVKTVPATTQITASASSVTSSASTIYVHLSIDSITITPALLNCASQKTVSFLLAHAFTNNNSPTNGCGGATPCEITSGVGPFAWNTSNASVVTVKTDTTKLNQGDATAVNPGLASVAAANGGTTSLPAGFFTCSPKSISVVVSGSNPPATSFTISGTATQALSATVVDTKGVTLSSPPLTWTSSAPTVAGVSSSGTVTGVSPGTTTILASCSPPSCNSGINQPIFSNLVKGTVSGSSGKLFIDVSSTKFATASPNCSTASSGTCTSFVPISSSDNSVGTAAAYPSNLVPNSVAFDSGGKNLLTGTKSGLLVQTASPLTNAPGTILSVSPDGNLAVVKDPGGAKVYVEDIKASTASTLNIANVVAADWTPDSIKLFLVAGSTVYVWIPGGVPHAAPATLPGTATDVKVIANGAYVYVASGSANISAYATCDNSFQDGRTLSGLPVFLQKVPASEKLVAVNLSNLDIITATPAIAAGCPTAVTDAVTTVPLTVTYGVINQLQVTPDGTKAVILGDKGVVVVPLAGGTPAVLSLGGATAFQGAITLDSAKLYVGASDNKVHVINLTTNTEGTPITISFPNQTVAIPPDLVVLHP